MRTAGIVERVVHTTLEARAHGVHGYQLPATVIRAISIEPT